MIDCGQLHHLTKKLLKSIGAIFISHTHMDHFIGMDTLARSILVTNKTVDIIGPKGIAEKMFSKLQAYTWNLQEAYYCNFNIYEIEEEVIKSYLLDGCSGFKLLYNGEKKRNDLVVYENDAIIVESEICDHKIPVLVFKVSEKPTFQIDEEKLSALKLKTGPWLENLKEWFYSRTDENGSGWYNWTNVLPSFYKTPETLYEQIKSESETNSIGYITDIGFTEGNIERISSFMKDVTVLVSECTYLAANEKKARESFHLCSSDLNELTSILSPSYLVPMHLSKTYLNRSNELYCELKLPKNCRLIKLPKRITNPPLTPKMLCFKNKQTYLGKTSL